MGLFDRLKGELKTAGGAAKGAIDEAKARIEIFRVRQSADAAAQALGYAINRARKDGKELEKETFERLTTTLNKHEAEAARLELELARHRGETPPARSPEAPAEKPAEKATGESPAEAAKSDSA
jgi:hypothetical protein